MILAVILNPRAERRRRARVVDDGSDSERSTTNAATNSMAPSPDDPESVLAVPHPMPTDEASSPSRRLSHDDDNEKTIDVEERTPELPDSMRISPSRYKCSVVDGMSGCLLSS